MSFKKWIDLTLMKPVIMNHIRELYFNAWMPCETIRGVKGKCIFLIQVLLTSIWNSSSKVLMLSTYYPLRNPLLYVTALISSNAYSLPSSSATINTSVPSLSDVTCHLLHPVVLWHLAHCLMRRCASASLIQPYDIELGATIPIHLQLLLPGFP